MAERFRRSAAAWLIGACMLAGCASGSAAEPNGARPAMWKLADEDTTIYLFGTVHVLPKDQDWRTAGFEKALAASSELMLEIGNIDDPSAVGAAAQKLAFSPGLPPLTERVSPEKKPALEAMIAQSGVPAEAFDRLETWAAALQLFQVTLARLGLSPDAGVEKTIVAYYKQSGKPVLGLETFEQQFGMFDRLSEKSQRLFLESILEPTDELRQQMAKMLDAWSRGDEAGIAATFDEEANLSPELRKVLLSDRNARWAAWLDERMDQPGTVFVAVGAGHLAGAESVQAMLKSRGLKATRIQ